MRVTVCEISDDGLPLDPQWAHLRSHVEDATADLVLLPEMPFAPWLPASESVEPERWTAAVDDHDRWLDRLDELGGATVAGTRPVVDGGERYNEGFVWTPGGGYRAVHRKAFLPDQDGVWEASWYEAGEPTFEPFEAGGATLGLLVCTELWAGDRVREYGRSGVDLLAVPRATEPTTLDKWRAAGRAAAVSAGAFLVSSNRVSDGLAFGGEGWVIHPDGEVLARTDRDRPAATVDIDLDDARRAKDTYPRYALE